MTDNMHPNPENGEPSRPSHHPFDQDFHDPLWWAKTPGFHPLKAVAVIAGFAIFHPLGIALLAWFVFNAFRARRYGWGGGHGPYAFSTAGGPGRRCGRGRSRFSTGNAAFDEHRTKVMDDLEKERQDFAEAQSAERRKRDLEAFEAFKASKAQNNGKPPATTL